MSNIKSSRSISIDWQTLFRLWSVQGFVAFLWLLLLPTSTRSEVALGFSAARLLLLAVAALLSVGSIALLFQSRKSLIQQKWLDLDRRPALWDLIYLISIAASLLAPLFVLVLYNLPDDPANRSYAARLSPLAFWVTLSGLELAIFLGVKRRGDILETLKGIKPQLRITMIFLSVILFLAGIIIATKVGVTPDRNWGAPAVPFLEWQILLALLIVGTFAFFPRVNSILSDAQIAFGIYVFTLALSLNQPIVTAFFATPPMRPTNFERSRSHLLIRCYHRRNHICQRINDGYKKHVGK